jgi:Family of unknown function (DUF5767)
MDDFIEITELNDISTGSNSNSKSVNFGGGLELLMNDKAKSGGKKNSNGDVNDLDDLATLEFELNNLTDADNLGSFETFETNGNNKSGGNKSGGGFANLFSSATDSIFSSNETSSPQKEKGFSINVNKTLGEETADASYGDQTTWDGYSKINTPINPDKTFISPEKMVTKDEAMMEKFKLLKKIESMERKGVEFSKKYNMESSYNEMKCEYDAIMEDKAKQASIKFQGNMMLSIVSGIEYLNGKFDPFDINLDGWGEQVTESLTDYDDIFGELYDLYKDKTHVSPWLRLMFQLGGSGLMVHMTNSLMKTAMPNMDDILRQNPDLMRQFQSAAVNSMGQSNPGFSGFMNGVMNGGMGTHINENQGTMGQPTASGDFFSQSRGGNNMFGATSGMMPTMPPPPPRNPHTDLPPYKNQPSSTSTSSRPEMKGPSDINDILSGLKTKNVGQMKNTQQSIPSNTINMNENSTISVNDLKDLSSEGAVPKRSKRRPRSDKSNTLSLAL